MAASTRKILQLVFEQYGDRKKTLRIPDPRLDLTAAEIQGAMNYIVDENIYDGVSRAISARIVETTTQDFDVIDA